jgi:glycerophosphoryl diester phosphodiesterase
MLKKLFLVAGFLIANIVFADNAPIIAGVPHSAKNPPYVEVYAHRGARSYSPENTLPAYRTGLVIGTDWVDMDIGISKDGVIIVDHDPWLNPDILSNNGKFWAQSKQTFTNGATGDALDKLVEPYLVHNLTLAQLQQYEAGILNQNSPYAKYFPDQVAVPGTHMPTLQEVVNYVDKTTNKKVKYQIEIKNDPEHPNWTVSPEEFANKLYTLLKKNHMIDRAEIQSFDWEPLYYLQKLDPRIKTAYLLVGEEDRVRMLNQDSKIAGLWSGGKLLKDYNGSIPQMIKALGGSCYEPEDVELTKKDLDEAHRLGLKVVVWTWPEHSGQVFNPAVAQKLIDWGVDGIITDDPGRLNSMLAARYMHVPPRYNNAQ